MENKGRKKTITCRDISKSVLKHGFEVSKLDLILDSTIMNQSFCVKEQAVRREG